MHRIRAITAQVSACSGHPDVVERSEAERDSFQRTVMSYRMGIERLLADGTVPPMTGFDLALAGNAEGWVRVDRNEDVGLLLDQAERERTLDPLEVLPGPWKDAKTREEKIAVVQRVLFAEQTGSNVYLFAEWQMQYGGRGLDSNIAVPVITNHGFGINAKPRLMSRVILCDAEDSQRISHMHVQKEPNFKPVLLDGIIATDDNDFWRLQRKQLSEAFLPLSSLAKIMPKSRSRAKACAARLQNLASSGPVDMSDFLLHEAQAQLQLALLGAPEEVTEELNQRLRSGFMGDPSRAQPGDVGGAMQRLTAIAENQPFTLPSDGSVHGPLWAAVKSSGLSPGTNFGNVLLILFAGHDTTGHTMTWMIFELARHPDIQRELRQEVSAFFRSLEGRDPEYTDLKSLDLMDRCITETLRMWPAVPNGTFRQLHFDETVKGPDGNPAVLPKGTLVNINNWARHRNRNLWGADADTFNPYRVWQAGEVAHVGCPLAGITPESSRFSPFAHSPRSCLGRNFAQMEMRLIMLYILRDFEFFLASPFDSLAGKELGPLAGPRDFRGVNRGTMGPMDIERFDERKKPWYAMKMRVERVSCTS